VTSHFAVRAGYNFLFWTNVLRPGNALDPVINPAQVAIDPSHNPGALGPRPGVAFNHSDLLAHGIVAGIMLDW